jgi:hypothetical protein
MMEELKEIYFDFQNKSLLLDSMNLEAFNFGDEIINNLLQTIENEMIMNTFLNNIENNIENGMIMDTFLNNIENNIENHIFEYKTHPTATMIKESLQNFGNELINNLLQTNEHEMIIDTIENNIENHIFEYKTHPTATMIKESFLNFDNGDWLGFQKSYFLKRHRKNGDMFRIFDKTENYWNWNLFLRKFKRL